MSPLDESVIQSYYRVEDAGGFFDTFYAIFFAKSPEIPRKFAHTDMEKQKQVVMASLLSVLRLRTGDPQARRAVCEIGRTHSRQGHDIRPELYELWLDSLCEALRRHDPLYTPELEAAWRAAMRDGIDSIASMY
jgi:hemoglobin-like flavoprotein